MATERPTAGDADAVHTVTLQIGESGEPIRIALPTGTIAPEGVLPALQTIADEVVRRGIAAARDRGRPISCTAGCAACCRHLAVISDVEARALAGLVDRMPEPRRGLLRARFASAAQRMAAAGLAAPALAIAALSAAQLRALADGYFRQHIDCPFLEDERCSIYDERPLVCRRMLVTSPAEFCADPHDSRVRALRLPKLAAATLLLTSDEDPPQPAAVPLPLALDWVQANAATVPPRGADQWMLRFVQRLADTEA